MHLDTNHMLTLKLHALRAASARAAGAHKVATYRTFVAHGLRGLRRGRRAGGHVGLRRPTRDPTTAACVSGAILLCFIRVGRGRDDCESVRTEFSVYWP